MGHATNDVEEPSERHNQLAEVDAEIPPGALIERSPDGSITLVETEEEGLSVHVDPDSELGREMQRKSAAEASHPGEYILEAIEDALDGGLESIAHRIN